MKTENIKNNNKQYINKTKIRQNMQVDMQETCLTTWWQLNAFITEASLRNSILSLRLADSLTVFTATQVCGSPLTMSFPMPSYTMPKDPWPNSRNRLIFSRGTSHSSGSYTAQTPQTCRTHSVIFEMEQISSKGESHLNVIICLN